MRVVIWSNLLSAGASTAPEVVHYCFSQRRHLHPYPQLVAWPSSAMLCCCWALCQIGIGHTEAQKPWSSFLLVSSHAHLGNPINNNNNTCTYSWPRHCLHTEYSALTRWFFFHCLQNGNDQLLKIKYSFPFTTSPGLLLVVLLQNCCSLEKEASQPWKQWNQIWNMKCFSKSCR